MTTKYKEQNVGNQKYNVIPFVKWEITVMCEVRNEQKQCEESGVQGEVV